MKIDRSTMRVSIIIPLLAIAILGGLGIWTGGFKSIPVTPGTIYAAESTYAIALEGAVTYRKACVGYDDQAGHHQPVLPASCRTTLEKIQAYNRQADAAYRVIRGYEASPPGSAAQDFIAAVSIFKAAIPASP